MLLYRRLEDHPVSFLGVLRELVEVQIAIGIHRRLINLSNEGLVLFRRWQFANQRRNRRQLSRRQTFAPVPKRFGKLRVEVETTVAPSATRARLPIHREQPGFRCAHRSYQTRCSNPLQSAAPHPYGLVALPTGGLAAGLVSIQQFTGSTEVTDVGHTGTDEHFVDLIAPARQTADAHRQDRSAHRELAL